MKDETKKDCPILKELNERIKSTLMNKKGEEQRLIYIGVLEKCEEKCSHLLPQDWEACPVKKALPSLG
ncbi:hypothetical protein KAI56_03495 [Candidatus Parcubacteria bacterium]|nr:hypothetical protein [Candidatus Parcubacteria bacterium]